MPWTDPRACAVDLPQSGQLLQRGETAAYSASLQLGDDGRAFEALGRGENRVDATLAA